MLEPIENFIVTHDIQYIPRFYANATIFFVHLTVTMSLVGSFEFFIELCSLKLQSLHVGPYHGIAAAAQREPYILRCENVP